MGAGELGPEVKPDQPLDPWDDVRSWQAEPSGNMLTKTGQALFYQGKLIMNGPQLRWKRMSLRLLAFFSGAMTRVNPAICPLKIREKESEKEESGPATCLHPRDARVSGANQWGRYCRCSK